MSDQSYPIYIIVLIWIALLFWGVSRATSVRGGAAGLTLSFLFATSFQYAGLLSYLVPGYRHLRGDGSAYLISYHFTEATVWKGALQSVIGFAGFVFGAELVRLRSAPCAHRGNDSAHRGMLIPALSTFGAAAFVANGALSHFPLGQALGQVGRNVAVMCVCLGLELSRRENKPRLPWLLAAIAIPTFYLLIWGFTSYGFIVFTVFAGFWSARLRKRRFSRLGMALTIPTVTYVLLSFFVAWMSFRDALRRVLWGDANIDQRVAAVMNAFSRTKLISPSNFESLDWLNTRLNQYIFVGKAVELQEIIPSLRLNGASLFYGLLAWVPRFVWPDKPQAGGNSFVAQHTGMNFSASAAIGSGPIFEFYVNFGTVGVFVGMACIGSLVMMIDRRAAVALADDRLRDFARWFIVGIAFVAPLQTIFTMVNTAIVSWIAVSLLTAFAMSGRHQTNSAARAFRGS